MTTLQDRLRYGAAQLRAAGIDGADRDARLLVAHVAQIPANRLTLHLNDVDGWGPAQENDFLDHVAARCAHKPIAKIIGRKTFWGRDFWVTADVLDPRPETETLIAAALDGPFDQVLDLGAGSGAIIVSLLADRTTAQGKATDLSTQALTVAQYNADLAGVADRLDLQAGNIFDEWPQGPFDLIVSNPPYLAASEMDDVPKDTLFDPRMSLTDEADGLSFYRRIASHAPSQLSHGGRVMVEIGPTQGRAVAAMLTHAGFDAVAILQDLDERDRVVLAIWR